MKNTDINSIQQHAAHLVTTLCTWVQTAREDDRGDVPGWVMITLMSAMLVAGLMFIAGPALTDLFRAAIDQVAP